MRPQATQICLVADINGYTNATTCTEWRWLDRLCTVTTLSLKMIRLMHTSYLISVPLRRERGGDAQTAARWYSQVTSRRRLITETSSDQMHTRVYRPIDPKSWLAI